MPELPEVEITAELIGAATAGAVVESVMAPGINALKSFDPPLQALVGQTIRGIRRRGKLFLIDVGDDYTLLVHLMSAGRLQLFDKRASLRDKTSRLLVRLVNADGDGPLPEGSELRLREFGTRQRAWVKLLHRADVEAEDTIAELGPEAWPSPPEDLPALLAGPRPLYAVLRDQHVIAGIGRSWVDEILWTARMSPFKRGNDLDEDSGRVLRDAIIEVLGRAMAVYQEKLSLPLPDKLPLPLQVHRRNGQPCPRDGTTIEAVFYEDYVMCYCPTCQTDGRVLKDRRLSRLLK
jgi:formamidopyrimidine-DNA glycosylase